MIYPTPRPSKFVNAIITTLRPMKASQGLPILRLDSYDDGYGNGDGAGRGGSGFLYGGDNAGPGTYRPLVGESIADASRHYIS